MEVNCTQYNIITYVHTYYTHLQVTFECNEFRSLISTWRFSGYNLINPKRGKWKTVVWVLRLQFRYRGVLGIKMNCYLSVFFVNFKVMYLYLRVQQHSVHFVLDDGLQSGRIQISNFTRHRFTKYVWRRHFCPIFLRLLINRTLHPWRNHISSFSSLVLCQ